MPDALTTIRERLESRLGVDPRRVVPEARLREDLGIGSIAALDLVLELEDDFDMAVEDEELAGLSTVGDLLRLVEARAPRPAGG